MRQIYYYGVEIDKEATEYSGFPHYQMGIFCHNIQDNENKEKIKQEIETRCRKNVGNTEFCDIYTGKPLKNFRSFFFIEK